MSMIRLTVVTPEKLYGILYNVNLSRKSLDV